MDYITELKKPIEFKKWYQYESMCHDVEGIADDNWTEIHEQLYAEAIGLA